MAWPEALLAGNDPGIHQDGDVPGHCWNGVGFYTTIKKIQLGDRDGRTPVTTPVPRDPRIDSGILQAAPEEDLVPYNDYMDSLVPLFSERRIAEQ